MRKVNQMEDKIKEMQKLLKEAYEEYFENGDGHCKSSEGYIYVQQHFPVYWNYGEDFNYVFDD